MFLAPTDEKKISYLIESLNERKSVGIEDIPIRIIKSAKLVIAPYLSKIFYNAMKTGQYPDQLKIAKVTPIHKGGHQDDV